MSPQEAATTAVNNCDQRQTVDNRSKDCTQDDTDHEQDSASSNHESHGSGPGGRKRFLFPCHRIRSKRFGRRLELGTILLVILVILQIPLPDDDRLFPFPQLEERGGPEGHENGKEHGGRVVKEVCHFSEQAGFVQLLITTSFIAKGTQSGVSHAIKVTDLFTGRVVLRLHRSQPIHEAQGAHNRRVDQHFRVKPQPTEVQCDLVPEIFPDQTKWLLFVELGGSGPFQVEQPSIKQGSAGVRLVVAAFVQRKTRQIRPVVQQPAYSHLPRRGDTRDDNVYVEQFADFAEIN